MERRDKIFKIITEEYIKSANPIGSSFIVDKYFPDISSATVRNEMMELEKEGLIYQPYTSAGRIPTTIGYKYYLDNFLEEKAISLKNKESIDELVANLELNQDSIKSLAKVIAEFSGEAVLVGFGAMDVYYTGISNLFSKPEFIEQSLVYSMSKTIDELDKIMAGIFYHIEEEVSVMMGEESPFGSLSSVVIGKFDFGDGKKGIMGILGPNRMDYRENLGLVRYSQEAIKKMKKK